MSPLAIELYAGTMSGTAGWSEIGGRAVGFDLAYQDYHGTPLGWRVIQDVLTLDGAQFKDADFIWGSSPCQAYSYLAMPWSRSKCPLCKGKKEYFAWQIENRPPANMAEWGEPIACDCKENSAKAKELRRRWELDGPDNILFDSVSRIAREASAAAGREIPYVQENVRGAVPWVGKCDMSLERWRSLTQEEKVSAGRPNAVFGSFFMWGGCGQIGKRVIAGRDLMDIRAGRGRFGMGVAPERAAKVGGYDGNGSFTRDGHHWRDRLETCPGEAGRKVPGFRFDGSGRSFQSASVESTGVKVPGQIQGKEYAMCRTGTSGQKVLGYSDPRRNGGKGVHLTSPAENEAGTKIGGDWFSDPNSTCRKHGSKSNARKAASALIAKIPPALSRYIAEQHYPVETMVKHA